MKGKFSVGIARVDITPPVGGPLQGYTPWRNSESIHDPLHLTAYLIQQGDKRVMLASADLVGIPTNLNLELRTVMAEAIGMKPEHILLAPTHTHSGPVTNIDKEGKCCNPVYFEIILKNAAIHAAKEAAQNVQPAELGIGTTQSQVAINRRELDVSGQVVLGQEPLGSYDPTMTVISFRTHEGKVLGNIVHYGCHNTASGNGTEITRDWCGVMVDRMDEQTGGITAFINGCQGDCGPRLPNGKTTGNVAMAQELGGVAAVDSMRAFHSIRCWEDEIDLRVLSSSIKLPYGKIASEEDMLRELEQLGDPSMLTSEPLIYYNSVMNQLEMVRSGKAAKCEAEGGKSFDLTVIAVGPVAFMPVPFETFSGVTVRISRHSPFPWTVCISNANAGNNGYLPTQDQLCRGGYEVHSFRFPNGYPLAENTDQNMVAAALELLEILYHS